MFLNSSDISLTRFLSAAALVTAICSSCTLSAPNLKQMESEGELFAENSIAQIGEHWDTKAFTERADSSLLSSGDPTPLLKVFASKLGTIKKVGELRREKYNEAIGIFINRPDYSAIYTCDAEYKLGRAKVTIGVIHKDEKWLVSNFYLNSKLLEKMNQSDDAASEKYTESIAPKICDNLSVDFVKQYADTHLKEDLNDAGKALAAKAMFFAVSKGLGHFKHCAKVKSGGCSFVQGQYVYTFTAAAEFENGRANITIGVVKEAGQWKLRGFNIQAHT